MNPLSLTILLSCVVGVLFLSKRKAALAFIVGTLYLSQTQNLNIAGFLFYPTRLLGIAGFLRVVMKKEFAFSEMNKVDSALLLLYGYTTFILILRPGESIPLRIAKATDVIFCYFSFRAFIRSLDDLRWLLKGIVVLLIPYTLLLAVEFFKKAHPFAIFGANQPIWLREGRPRCFGTFRHPSLLGSLGATFIPLFIALYWDQARRKFAVLGLGICGAIVFFSNSGGPLSAAAMGLVGWGLWSMRNKMKTVRRCMVWCIFVLALVMKAPIWYLLARLSAVTGGTGWHRAYLIDVTVRHINEWWLAGLPLTETHGWFMYNLAATGGADVTNQFISFALNGGMIAISLFVFVLYRSFSVIGRARMRTIADDFNLLDERLVWGLGTVLAVHVANWLGITYWDQFYVIFLLQLAATITICENLLGTKLDAFPEANQEEMGFGSLGIHDATKSGIVIA